jgi:Tfp pilus assembly protein PilV
MRRSVHHRGILLIEVLLAVGFLAALVAVGTQVSLVSMRSTTSSEYKDVAQRLGRELLEGARLAASSDWYQIYNAPRATALIATTTGNAWLVTTGVETLRIGTHEYTRSFTVASTSRDLVTRDIHPAYDPAAVDPSTLLLSATVQVADGGSVTVSEYVTRWRNIICRQSVWTTGSSTSAHAGCATGDFDETTIFPSGSVQIGGGTIMLAP